MLPKTKKFAIPPKTIYLGTFLVGILLAIVSLFLPWETVRIDENGLYQYFPFSGWVVHSYNFYDDMPVDFPYFLGFFIAMVVYCGAVIPLVVYCGNVAVGIRGKYYLLKDIFLKSGPILTGVTVFVVSLQFILNFYFLPYVNISIIYDNLERYFSYAMGEGMTAAFLSVIFMLFGACMLQTPIEGLPIARIGAKSAITDGEEEKIEQTPRQLEEEYQKVEDSLTQALLTKHKIKASARSSASGGQPAANKQAANNKHPQSINNKHSQKETNNKQPQKEPNQPIGGTEHELELE